MKILNVFKWWKKNGNTSISMMCPIHFSVNIYVWRKGIQGIALHLMWLRTWRSWLWVVANLHFFTPTPKSGTTFLIDFKVNKSEDQLPSPCMFRTFSQIAFLVDSALAFVPTLLVFCFVILCFLCFLTVFSCSNTIVRHTTGEMVGANDCCPCCTLIRFMCMSKVNHRFISLSCNCPCYVARPKLRFQVRFFLVILFFGLRLTATILYSIDKNTRVYGQQIAMFCGFSWAMLFPSLIIDFYHFRMWWYYRPAGVYEPCQMCCDTLKFYSAHRRFLPMLFLGKFQDMTTLGDRPLEHIVMFHSYNYRPLRRFDPLRDTTHIGFHKTEPDLAISIAKNGFWISEKTTANARFWYLFRSFVC